MQQFIEQVTRVIESILRSVTVADIADILIVAFLLYMVLSLTHGTRGSQLIKGLVLLFVAYVASDWLHLRVLYRILNLIVNSGAIVLVVLFQEEIRKVLEQLGRAGSKSLERLRSSDDTAQGKTANEKAVKELIAVLLRLSFRKVGALIVLECSTGLEDFIQTGTRVDAEISAPLLENIFEPNTPLHDGAVIIRGARVTAAACILPLSSNPSISRDLGTRHRASLGISEMTDSIVLVVSEETGIISVAQGGKLTRNMDAASLRPLLEEHFNTDSAPKHKALIRLKSNKKGA